jgi:hypothetical protein
LSFYLLPVKIPINPKVVMSTNKQNKAKQNLLKQVEQLSKINLKQQIQWLLRSLLIKDRSTLQTGFVLPTVVMVSLVVVLLSVALVVRAFDRSKNASNVRVNQVVLNAATPALDRAKAKIDALFADDTLPRTTPSDIALNNAFLNSPNKYRFGDETRLKLVKDLNVPANGIQTPTATTLLENNETINTAWKYPVDTNNNGLFDSYTLYGIYFRSPTRDATGKFNRQRNPLEARTPPMSSGYLGSQCTNAAATRANLVGDSSWYSTGGKLTKSFYVYTATVPITAVPANPSVGVPGDYEPLEGNKGFSALEYEQDRNQIPLNNNAVVFQDDLELSPGPDFRLNGRVFTNANLLIGGHGGSNIRLFQVSSPNSCFYKEENAKVTVGGNVGTGNINDATDQRAVAVDLYDGFGNAPLTGKVINSTNKSTSSTGGSQVGYNDTAYSNRIALMKGTALSYSTTNPPTIASVNAVTQYPTKEVKSSFSAKITANPSLDTQQVLGDVIELYLRDRTRRVPYAEIATPDANATGSYTLPTDTTVFAAGTIEPPITWREPTNANTGLTLSATQLEQTDPDKQKRLGKEVLLGDRISVGNNLPAYWKNTLGKFVTGPFERQLLGSTVFWNDPTDKLRFRTTQVVALPDLGISDRTGFWEDAAAQTPATITSSTGGLRVVTGAGIYVDDDGSATVGTPNYSRATFSFLGRPQLDPGVTVPTKFITAFITTGNDNIVTWTDMMPMTGGVAETRKGDLQMRATAIYHYKDTSYTDTNYINRTPTACISSYYDPTNSVTARNPVGLPDVSGVVTGTQPAVGAGRSNNGVVYPAPYTNDATRTTAVGTYRSQLNRQARLIFPNGRIVNEPLRNALTKIDASGTRSLVDNSAIDTAICGIRILTDTTFVPNLAPPIAHGAIKESSFLDARQAKALDQSPTSINPVSLNELIADNDTTNNYDLDLEQRKPLEIRATDIDMNLLRTRTIGGATNQEYMLPNSGIIYATREDALRDESAGSATVNSQTKLLSPTDFKLDPTRRPNGIRLINGSNLARDNNFRIEEKGLILVTDLPVYIRGDFNQHRKPGATTLREEFTDILNATWSNFYTRTAATLNPDFACRTTQSGCGTDGGDQWRPATVISDATSLLSAGFVDGFRDWGDYDLNNNAGFSTITNRLKNGFYENSFATSSLWWDATNTTNNTPFPANKPGISYVSSYLTNGVSPVQRRTTFPEYVMETCRKIPVSECNSNDWVVGFDLNGDGDLSDIVTAFDVDGDGTVGGAGDTEGKIKANQLGRALVVPVLPSVGKVAGADNILQGTEVNWATQYLTGLNNKSPLERLGAGTTARAALIASDQRYARRVAFARNQINTLAFITIGTKNVVKPLGIGCPLDTALITAAPEKNGCEYPNSATRTAGTHYGLSASNALWFRTTDNTTGDPGLVADIKYQNDRSLYYLPPNIDGGKIMLPDVPEIAGVTSLNGTGTNDPSDFTMCVTSSGTGSGISQQYLVSSVSGTCSIDLNPQVAQLLGLTATGSLTGSTQTVTASATNNLNVYTLPSGNPTINNGATITLNGNSESIFVFQGDNSVSFGANGGGTGINLKLNGVNPNNIFWVSNGSLDINDATIAAPHKLAGNFIGKTALKIGAYTQVLGGRFLNFTTTPGAIPATSFIYAVTSEAQPILTPVLQVHSPGGTPANNLDTTTGNIQGNWIQQAGTATTFNAAFVTGNSPSRPAEESAGLHNFVRFMESWNNTTVNIKGSFIQLRRSSYATGPFSPIRSSGNAPITTSNNGSLSIFNYPQTLYPQGGGGNTLTFYAAPTRQWGYDVALLTQPPDLFAQRFTQQSTSAPDEFFRQVGKDDPWVQNLLCAAQGSGTAYTAAIGDQRPASCPVLTEYND